MKKLIASTLLVLFALVAFSGYASAAPNPAYPNTIFLHDWKKDSESTVYPLPVLADPDEEGYWKLLYGWDLVVWRGKSNKIHQWFIMEDGSIGYHSVWNPMNDKQNCPIKNAEVITPGWGDYTYPGSDIHFPEDDTAYCVITNEFKANLPITWLRYLSD